MSHILKYIFAFYFLLSGLQAFSQSFTVYGVVKSESDSSTFSGATILLKGRDNQQTRAMITGKQGNFRFDSIPNGLYSLTVDFIGFATLEQDVNVHGHLNLGTLTLQPESSTLDEVMIIGRASPGKQRGDTTEFNAAAFKTLPDASAQNLIEKMPGITLMDGKIQAQGEDVQQILVDGKPFFGGDVKAALQNLPADAIAQIQVYDKKSDKAELSGFDDGEKQKTINIITKPDRKKGQFGKVYAGYGTDSRHLLGASINMFNNDRRTTVTALSNNINALDYSADPNSQDRSNTQDGIIKANSLGVNFSDKWGEKTDFSGSYVFSHRENQGRASLIREYILPSDSGQVYIEDNNAQRRSMTHQANMRIEFNIDSNNRIIVRPNISLQHDKNVTGFSGNTKTDHGPLNQTENALRSKLLNYDFSNGVYYSHRFRKKGRSFTLGLNAGYHLNEDDDNRIAHNIFYTNQDIKDEQLNQHNTLDRTGVSWNINTSYTEPAGKNGQFELEYKIRNMDNRSDRFVYNLYEDEVDDITRQLDSALSNSFTSDYLAQEVELGYQFTIGKIKTQIEAEYQNADLRNSQKMPAPFNIRRRFESVLPTVRLDYKISPSQYLEFNYDTWTNAPSIGQLQEVINNSNPLHLRTGNPDLDQATSNRLTARYRSMNRETRQSLFIYLASSIINNNIVNSTMVADAPLELGDGIVLQKGSQLARPVNLDGYWDFRSYFSFGRPLNIIKSNVGLNGSVNYSHRPGMINEDVNFVSSSNFRVGLSLSSNISEKIDFNLSTRSSYNIVENSLRPALSTNYFNQSTRLRYDWIIQEGFIYRASLNHQFNTGLAEDFDNSFLILNMSIGKKILPKNRGELSLSVYDLLEQNDNVRRNVSELYIEDLQSNVLQRYFMLTFAYNIRHFSRGTSDKDFQEHKN